MLESFEPISGEVTEFPISTEWAKEIEAHMSIYEKEKALYCGAIFLAGTMEVAGKKETVMAPLYIYPTELLLEDEVYYISIDENNPIINPAILNAIGEGQTGLMESLISELPKGYLNFDKIDKLEKTLQKYFQDIDVSPLELLPNLLTKKDRDEIIKSNKKNNGKMFLPVAGLCLVKKPVGSRGILNELEELANWKEYSQPVEILLGNKNNNPTNKSFETNHVPAMLSKTQEHIVRDALKYPLRLVIGPPGTGKSFTIAALATEMLGRGKSVLIASKNVEAVDVVADKIERDLGLNDIIVRASRKGFRKAAQVRLKNISYGIELKDVNKRDLNRADVILAGFNKKIKKLEKEIIDQHKNHLSEGEFLANYAGGFFDKIKMEWLTFRRKSKTPIWILMNWLEKEIEKKNLFLKKYIKQFFFYYLKQAFRHSRSDLNAMNKAMRARTGNKKSEYFEDTDFRNILKALPIWTVSLSDVHKVFPMNKELFDLVIIDEATQCDIASSLPLLQRGKNALIVGDPKQLRHLSFLSFQQQRIFSKINNVPYKEMEALNYRDDSLLDLVNEKINNQDCIYFLNEHYRSMPDIISFSNKTFYAGQLHIMTESLETKNKKHNFIKKINGKRNARGYNQFEADAILAHIKELMETEIGEEGIATTIGIVSPFRDQINHIQKKTANLFSATELEKHRILIGTPFAFQGEERDVIFISFVLDDNSHPSAFHYLNKPDVFNVCVTRARNRQYNCISFLPEKLNNNNLFGQYISFVQNGEVKNDNREKEIGNDPFLNEVKNILKKFNVDKIIIGHEMAGVMIDLFVVHNGKSYGIDLAGYPGLYEETVDLNNWKMIYRTGVPIFYLAYSDWVLERNKVVLALKVFLK